MTGPTALLTATGTFSPIGAASTSSQNPNAAIDSSEKSSRLISMTIFSVVQRLSLFVLSTLTPLDELATLNIRRLRVLIQASNDKKTIPRQTTPVNDWMLVAFVHVTITLQRLAYTFAPIYHLIGITNPAPVVNVAGT
jgi:hypothetical protein